MYQVISSYYGSLTTKEKIEDAIYWARKYKAKGPKDAVITIWKNEIKIITIGNSTRKAKAGDIVTCKGIKATIKEIYYQDRNDGTCDWDIEFIDTNGIYRYWKQYFDGGEITLID